MTPVTNLHLLYLLYLLYLLSYFIYLLTYLLTYFLLTYLLTYLLAYFFTYLLTYLLTYLHTYKLSYILSYLNIKSRWSFKKLIITIIIIIIILRCKTDKWYINYYCLVVKRSSIGNFVDIVIKLKRSFVQTLPVITDGGKTVSWRSEREFHKVEITTPNSIWHSNSQNRKCIRL